MFKSSRGPWRHAEPDTPSRDRGNYTPLRHGAGLTRHLDEARTSTNKPWLMSWQAPTHRLVARSHSPTRFDATWPVPPSPLGAILVLKVAWRVREMAGQARHDGAGRRSLSAARLVA